jgi:hypothetical protein
MIAAAPPLTTLTGIGTSQIEDSFEAGVEIAKTAVANSELSTHTIFFLFSTAEHDNLQLMKGIRSVLGEDVVFLGCTSKGVVAKEFISYNGILAGGCFISSPEDFFKVFFQPSVLNREYEAGEAISKEIAGTDLPEDTAYILFYDSVKQTSGEGIPQLNLATPIIEGFVSAFKSCPNVAGIGAFADLNFSNPCKVWAGDQLSRQGLAVAAVYGGLKMHQVILRGTRPNGAYHKITKASGNIIYELDGKPALDMVSEIMGTSIAWEDFPFLITLGVNNGDKYAPYDEDNYYSRICFGVNKEERTLIMFETDLQEGLEVQFMRREIDFDYIKPRVEKLVEQAKGRKPVLAFYIDCIGRVSAFAGLQEEESIEVAQALGDIPFFGIFSGVEIGKVGNDIKALDWTGVLCLFSEA